MALVISYKMDTFGASKQAWKYATTTNHHHPWRDPAHFSTASQFFCSDDDDFIKKGNILTSSDLRVVPCFLQVECLNWMSASRKEREKKMFKAIFFYRFFPRKWWLWRGDVLLSCWYVSCETGKFMIYKVIVKNL